MEEIQIIIKEYQIAIETEDYQSQDFLYDRLEKVIYRIRWQLTINEIKHLKTRLIKAFDFTQEEVDRLFSE